MTDKNNNVITINAVRYELSPSDWKLQQQILSRAHKSVSEKLNGATVAGLIGHTDVVYYNYETKAWNTSTYNGYPINGQETDAGHAQAFKAAMERMPEFSAQYEMAATVTMTIDLKFYPGWRKTISNPQYRNNGTAVVGNIIVKNKTTGRYELYCKSWVGVYDCDYPNGAVDNGAYWFAFDGAWNSDFRAAVVAAHTR